MKYYLAKSVRNIVNYSQYFTIASTHTTITNGYGIAPDGDQDAVLITTTNTGYDSHVQPGQVSSITNGSFVSASVFIGKSDITSCHPAMRLQVVGVTDTGSSVNNYVDLAVNTKTGNLWANKLDVSSSYLSFGIDDCGSYWRIFAGFMVNSAITTTTSGYWLTLLWPSFTTIDGGGENNSGMRASLFWGHQQSVTNSQTSFQPFISTSGSRIGSESNFIEINPEYNYEITGKKIEDRKRARSGREYVYKWGQYDGRKFDVSYISDTVKTKINSWWSGNDSLLFIDGITTNVTSVRIQNDKTPISKLEKPYTNLWAGTIELETY